MRPAKERCSSQADWPQKSKGRVGSTAYVGPVAKGGVEWLSLWVEEFPDVTETGNFKDLRLLLNNLSGKHRAEG